MKHAGPGHDMSTTCPMRVAGTSAQAVDVDGGVALEFTTTGDVAELRRRVAKMAEMHGQKGGMMGGGMMGGGMMGGGMMGGGMMGGGGMMRRPPSTVRVEETAQGARLIFTPKDPKDLEALRQHERRHAEHANSGQCPMMEPPDDARPQAPATPNATPEPG